MSLVPNLEFIRIKVSTVPVLLVLKLPYTKSGVSGCLKIKFLACPTRMGGPS